MTRRDGTSPHHPNQGRGPCTHCDHDETTHYGFTRIITCKNYTPTPTNPKPTAAPAGVVA